ncbi:MAG: N-acetylmuramic acid 6-phosphate etherase [Sphaerochaeta sp.]|nr:N-acetylmuramic acid 6-phosphate etherase [Sphaerochaeta sp.]
MKPLMETEQRNPLSYRIDSKSTLEILDIINAEDKRVPFAVESAIPSIAAIVDDVVSSFNKGGRLFYIGAGTSGRLGVLDASECPPTYGVDPAMVQGIIAGGAKALTTSVEWAEDDGEAGIATLKDHAFSPIDVLIGITASGGAPFVVEAMRYAKELGAKVGAISCNKDTAVFDLIDEDHRIFVPVGPEIITGSTRMKSGTAQKLVLNMITTTAMIRIGKVFNNLMVDLRPVNAKLILRARRLITEVTGCSQERAIELFESSGHNTKVAITMGLLSVNKQEATELLQLHEGSISRVLDSLH